MLLYLIVKNVIAAVTFMNCCPINETRIEGEDKIYIIGIVWRGEELGNFHNSQQKTVSLSGKI